MKLFGTQEKYMFNFHLSISLKYMHPLLSRSTGLAQNQTNFLPEYVYY